MLAVYLWIRVSGKARVSRKKISNLLFKSAPFCTVRMLNCTSMPFWLSGSCRMNPFCFLAPFLIFSATRRHRRLITPSFRIVTIINEKALRETQTMRAGYSRWSQKISPRRRPPSPGARDGQNLISWRWSLPLPTNPVW